MLRFSSRAQERAKRAWRCSPFTRTLFRDLRRRGIPLAQIAGKAGVQAGYTLKPLGENRADQELMWLIQVGILRREVDGQGITDSYRLAPLGRQILDHLLQQEAALQPTLPERLRNQITRWRAWT